MPSPNDDDVHAFTGVVNVSQPQRRGTDPVVQKLMNEAHSRVLARAAAGPPQILPHDKPFPHHKIPPAAHPLVQQGELGGMRLAWPPASKGTFVDAQVQTDATAEFMADEMDSEATLVEPLSAPSSPASRHSAPLSPSGSPGADDDSAIDESGRDSDGGAALLRQLEDAEKTVVKQERLSAETAAKARRALSGALWRALGRCRERWSDYWAQRTRGVRDSSETLSWALNWMKREYPDDFRRCMVIIVFNAIFAGGSPLLSDQLLGAIIPNYQAGVQICILDLLLFASILVVGQMIYVWATCKARTTRAALLHACAVAWRPSGSP